MVRLTSYRAHVIRGAALLVAATAALSLSPSPSQAQLGRMIKKKAAEAAVNKAADKATDKEAQMNPDAKLGTPFTAEKLDRVLASLEINAASWARSDSIGKQIEQLENQRAQGNDRNANATNAYLEKNSKWTTCKQDVEGASDVEQQSAADQQSKKLEELIRRDPSRAQVIGSDYAQMQLKVQQLLAKGDTTAAFATSDAWFKKWGLATAPRTTNADVTKKCGPEPTPPAWMAQEKGIQARIDTLRVRQRDATSDSKEKALAASGMSNDEYFPLNERLELWYAIVVKGQKGVHFWKDDEGAILEARKARIKRIFEAMHM